MASVTPRNDIYFSIFGKKDLPTPKVDEIHTTHKTPISFYKGIPIFQDYEGVYYYIMVNGQNIGLFNTIIDAQSYIDTNMPSPIVVR